MTKLLFCVLLLLLFVFNVTFCAFGPSDLVYDEEEAIMIFDLVAAAHSEEPQVCLDKVFDNSTLEAPKILSWIDERCDFLTSKCTGLVLEFAEQKRLVVAFRGTQSMTQFFFEGLSMFMPDAPFFEHGHINYYFHTTYTSVWPFLEPWLADPKYKEYDVIFSGHSLGGSLSSLFALRTIVDGLRRREQVKLLTFAEPRTGSFEFSSALDRLIEYKFRVVNGLDVLAHMPPCHKDFSYLPSQNLPCDPRSGSGPYHHVREIWYPDGMYQGARFVTCSATVGEDPFCSNRHFLSIHNFAKALLDHRKYFDVMVSQYGEYGCNRNRTFDENQGFLGMLGSISEVLKKLF